MRPTIFALALVSLLLASACERRASRGGPAVRSDSGLALDVEVLRRLLDEDPARGPLGDVENAIRDDRPVRAGELVEATALPAAREAALRVHAVTMRTAGGRALASRATAALDERTRALETYGHALARGSIEDVTLLDAARGYRRAEASILAVYEALERAERGAAPGSTAAAP